MPGRGGRGGCGGRGGRGRADVVITSAAEAVDC